MLRRFDAGQATAQVNRVRNMIEVVDRRVFFIGRAKHRFGLGHFVRLPDIVDRQRGDQHAFVVAQGDLVAGGQFAGELLTDIQRDRDRPQRTVGQAHVLQHRVVIGLVQKSFQRGKSATKQQLDIAQLPVAQVPGF